MLTTNGNCFTHDNPIILSFPWLKITKRASIEAEVSFTGFVELELRKRVWEGTPDRK